MLNRRKAMIGWLVYTAAKPFLKRALRSRVPGAGGGSRRSMGAVVAALGAALGGLVLWRSRRGRGEEPREG